MLIQKVLSFLVEKEKTSEQKALQKNILRAYQKSQNRVHRTSTEMNYHLVNGKIIATKRRKTDANKL
ncbi:MAG: hypothetical protein CMG85_17820 [Marinobacter sp.]|jgi:hypothetical protein|nr:hypothetical protein [Marinobacter sp.]|tara:strand:- start:417 stop:617 length:201 start_codon:yes stop_codon:yes gene_type:complete